MKKILGVIFLSLLLNGCGGGYSVFNAYIDQEYSNGGVIRNHFSSSTGQAGIKSLADNSCSSRGFVEAKLTSTGKAGEFKTHNFECISRAKQNETQKVELASMIDKAKDTCKSLGFKDGSEKFSDCSLKLYSQSVELAAEQNKTVVMQGQSSGSNVMTIYDPVRDNNALIKRGQGLINGTCTLGDLSNC